MISRHLRTIATLATPVALPVERLSGRWLGSTEPATLVFAGSAETAGFLAGTLMRIDRRQAAGRLDTPLALRGPAFDEICTGADLAVAELPFLWRSALPAGVQWRIPAWVSQEIRAPECAEIALPVALRKEVTRHTRRETYAVDFSTDENDVRQFFSGLYRPYVAERFGAGAVLVDEPRFLSVSRGMTLARLRAGKDWVAGLLFRHRGETLELGWFGASSIPPRSGASEVLDAAVIERAVSAGARRVIFGHSRPSLADGVVRYKSRFGAIVRPTRFPQRVIGIEARRASPALAVAMNAARLIAFPGGRGGACELSFSRPLSAGSPETSPST